MPNRVKQFENAYEQLETARIALAKCYSGEQENHFEAVQNAIINTRGALCKLMSLQRRMAGVPDPKIGDQTA